MSSGSEIPPTMYPQIGESVEFKRTLLDSYIDEKGQVKLGDFLANYNSIENSVTENSSRLFISEFENELYFFAIQLGSSPIDAFSNTRENHRRERNK